MKALWLLTILPLFLVGCIPGLTIRVDPNGCLPSGYCAGAGTNGYNAETRTVLLSPDYTPVILAHELCHVHQHEVILEQLHKEPGNSLREWYTTGEGQDYLTVAEPPMPGFTQEPLEDAAWACAYWFLGLPLDPGKTAWAERWLTP